MEGLAFDYFIKKIRIKASIEDIYSCWATGDGLEKWFLRSAKFFRNNRELEKHESAAKGDRYTWQWHNWEPTESGEILEANGRNRLLFTFGDRSKVLVELEDVKGGVMVILKQFDMPTDEKTILEVHVGCNSGWTFWLTNLKAYLEHGITLNETEMDISDDPLAGWEFANI